MAAAALEERHSEPIGARSGLAEAIEGHFDWRRMDGKPGNSRRVIDASVRCLVPTTSGQIRDLEPRCREDFGMRRRDPGRAPAWAAAEAAPIRKSGSNDASTGEAIRP